MIKDVIIGETAGKSREEIPNNRRVPAYITVCDSAGIEKNVADVV
jgi:hypothetical protein